MSIDSKIEWEPRRAGPARRYLNVFESPAVAFVEIDFTDVGATVSSLRQSGVTDLKAHLLANPDVVRKMMRVARIVNVNEHAIELFKPGRRQDLFGSLEQYWPDGSNAIFAESVVAAVDGTQNFTRETVMRTLQGAEFDAEVAVHFDAEGAGGGLVTVAILDVSERNRARAAMEHAEFMYRNMFHGMAVPFLRIDSTALWEKFRHLRERGVVDIDGYFAAHPRFVREAAEALVIVEANHAAVKLHRATSESELLGSISRFWTRKEPLIRAILAAGFRGDSGFRAETRLLAMDGNEVDVLLFIIATSQMRAKGIALAGLIDTTQQVAARDALETMRSELAHATRVSLLGELTASIAHEINQPLTAITTSGDAALRWLARPDFSIEEIRVLLARIVADGHRAADVMDRVRAMAVRRNTQTRPVAINSVVEEVATFLRRELRSHGVALSLDLDASLEEIRADRIQIQQVILNLSVNAIQAMDSIPADHRCLRIVTGRAEKGVFVRVQDSGPGIAAESIPRLFEGFHSTKEGGMGMGLRISQSIVEAHGGSIEGSNNADGGACFRVTLPAGA